MEKLEKENRKNEVYEELRNLCIENAGGFTRAIFVDGGKIKFSNSLHGRYVVAFTNYTLADFRNKDAGNILHEIYNFINANPRVHPADFTVGGWLDSGDKRYYTDLGITLNNLNEALDIAKRYGQKAIYDLQGQKEIFV